MTYKENADECSFFKKMHALPVNISYLIPDTSFVYDLLVLFWMFGLINRTQRENFLLLFFEIFWDGWSYCHFLAGDDGHTGSLHE